MSHWTKCKTEITDLEVLKKAAKVLGVEVLGRNKQYNSHYDSTFYDAHVVLSYENGTAAIIKKKNGTYEMMVDNYHNPITQKLGNDCTLLGREYSKLLVEQQAMMMGGMVTQSRLMDNGTIQMQITL